MRLRVGFVGSWCVVPFSLLAASAHASPTPEEARAVAEASTRVYDAACGAAAPGAHRCFAHRLRADAAGPIAPDLTAPYPGSLSPSDLLSAYAVPAGTQSGGAVIGIVDAYGDTRAETDLAAYRKQYGLPALPKCVTAPKPGDPACFTQVGQTGGAIPPAATGSNTGWNMETALDIEMVSGICPDCSIVLVESDDALRPNMATAVLESITLGAEYVSNSYGSAEIDPPTGMVTFDPALDQSTYKHAGVMIFAATGDQDYNDQDPPLNAASPNYPATSPFVFGIGGTTLTQGGGARGWTEVVWSHVNGGHQQGTGSGCSDTFPLPTFQSGLAMGSCKKRGAADLSAAADAPNGISIYSEQDGGWIVVGGTSAATPIVAAILARIGIKGKGPAYAYAHASAFYDVTTGNNDPGGTCNDVMCNGGPGWDGPTGLGTPNAAELASGTIPDAGPDSGGADAGGSDGGADAGRPKDAGQDSSVTLPDSGPTTGPADASNSAAGGIDSTSSGCGCMAPASASPLEAPGVAALVAGVAAALRSRRRRRQGL
jgi:hypothetical protein